MSKVQEILEAVKGMTVLELSELVKAFEEEFGVSAAAPVAMAAAPGAAPAAAAAPEEEKTEFDVILTAIGLKEAKDLVDGAPKPVKEKVTKEEAEAIKTKLTDVGASVEIK
jgi:large subunit ribosomal protein L7/L12